MKKLLTTLICAYKLWKVGFYLTDNTDTYTWDKGKTYRTDGFIRLHFVQGSFENHCVADWDLLVDDNKLIFVDMKADNLDLARTTFRYDIGKG